MIARSRISAWPAACLCTIALAASLPAQTPEQAAKSQRAKAAITAGRYTQAITLYRELVRELPESTPMRMNLGLALHSAGRYREAVDQFQAVLRREPGMTPARLLLGLGYLKLGQPDAAIAPLKQVLDADPGNAVAKLELAGACLSARRPAEAAERFQAIVSADPENAKAWQGLGLSYVALLYDTFRDLDTSAPESPYRDVLLAHSMLQRGKARTAFRLYRDALAKAPALKGIHAGIADVYRAIGRADWARVEDERESRVPLPQCGGKGSFECDFLAGNYERILERSRESKEPEAYYWRSNAYLMLSQRAFARLEAMPSTSAIHELLADAYRIQGNFDLSIMQWQEALKLSPNDRRLRKGLARVYWLKRDYAHARPLLQELLRLEPESAELNLELGDSLVDDNPARAVPYLERALRYDPNNLGAHAALGRAYMRVDQPVKAIPHLKAALSFDDRGRMYYQLGQAYKLAGQEELARPMLQKYREIIGAGREKPAALEDEAEKITGP